MLSLKPPYLQSGNLVIFQDDTDDTAFYYISNRPSISVNDNGEVMFSSYAIIPESGVNTNNQGILEAGISIDICLAVSDEELLKAREDIKENFKVKCGILSPAPIHDGNVRFVMAQAGDVPDPSKWFVTSNFQPSLMGQNTASIPVKASGNDAKMLISTVNSDEVAAGVYYDLGIVGITPVYRARMVADMQQVYHSFLSREKTNAIFYSKEIENIIEDLAETKALTIEVEETDPDIKAEAMKNLLAELKNTVVSQYFSPAPVDQGTPDLGDMLGDLASVIVDSAKSLIDAIIPGYHILNRTIDATTLTTVTFDLNQKNAKIYRVSPQALLTSMAKDANLNMAEKIKWIELDKMPFFSQEVNVRIAANTFESTNMNAVTVYCRVLNADTGEQVEDPATISFEAATGITSGKFNFTRKRDVNYVYEYKAEMYMTTTSSVIPDRLTLDWQTIDSPYIYVNPADFYRVFDIDVNLSDSSVIAPDLARMVQADVTLETAADETVLCRTLIFKEGDLDHKRLSVVAGCDVDLKYNVNLTYYIFGEKEIVSEYKDLTNSFFFVPDPFENRWSVDLICKADWEQVSRVYLDTRIHDAARSEPIVNHFVFTEETTELKLNAACSLDTPDGIFEYYLCILYNDGRKVEAGWLNHEGSPALIILADQVKSQRKVKIALKNTEDFANLRLERIKVEFVTLDAAGKEVVQEMEIKSADTVLEVIYELPADGSRMYKYKIRAKNAQKATVFKSSKYIESNEELLLLELS